MKKEIKPVDCKWVSQIKYNTDETFSKFEASLVGKGFTQTYEIDYLETFAPAIKLNTVERYSLLL